MSDLALNDTLEREGRRALPDTVAFTAPAQLWGLVRWMRAESDLDRLLEMLQRQAGEEEERGALWSHAARVSPAVCGDVARFERLRPGGITDDVLLNPALTDEQASEWLDVLLAAWSNPNGPYDHELEGQLTTFFERGFALERSHIDRLLGRFDLFRERGRARLPFEVLVREPALTEEDLLRLYRALTPWHATDLRPLAGHPSAGRDLWSAIEADVVADPDARLDRDTLLFGVYAAVPAIRAEDDWWASMVEAAPARHADSLLRWAGPGEARLLIERLLEVYEPSHVLKVVQDVAWQGRGGADSAPSSLPREAWGPLLEAADPEVRERVLRELGTPSSSGFGGRGGR